MKKFLTVVLIIAALAGLVFAGVKSADKPSTTSTDQATEDSQQSGGQDSSNQDASEPDKTKLDEPESTQDIDEESESSEVSVTITTLDQTASEVRVRAITHDLTSGTCTVTFQKSGQTDISKTAKLSYVTSYASCQGWDIDKSEFTSKGEWSVSVKVESGDQSGVSETKTVNVE